MTSISAIGLAGMNAALQQAQTTAARIAQPAPAMDDTLAADVVQLHADTYSFAANLKVVKVGDEMMGTLLDAMA